MDDCNDINLHGSVAFYSKNACFNFVAYNSGSSNCVRGALN